MSHATGKVRFNDGTVMFYEYNGTCDVVCNCLYDSYKEMHSNWRDQPSNECTCGNDEEVEIATNYADGYYWPGKACRKCKAITRGLGSAVDEYIYDEETEGLPDWWAEA